MITTLCMNPSFDWTLTVPSLQIGGLSRVQEARTDPGGKGLNVASVCCALGEEARCVCLAGEDGIARLHTLIGDRTETLLIPTPGSVRTNLKIRSLDGQPLTEINGAGTPVTREILDLLALRLATLAQESRFVVLTGSLPPECPADYYGELIQRIGPEKCVLDASGEALRRGLPAGPLLVKPNEAELAEAVGHELNSLPDVREAAFTLLNEGAQKVLVSLGARGAMLVAPEGTWVGEGLRVPVSSTVGAGDAMVAAALCGLADGDWAEALRRGVAAGSACVMTDGTQLLDPAVYRELLEQVQVRSWDDAAV